MSVRKIANRLNISPSTVSLALKGDVKISSRTRERVEKEAERIGYRRDAKLNELMAQLRHRGLRPTESCFGVLSFSDRLRPWESSEGGRELYRAMTARAERLGYRLEPFRVREPGMSLTRLREILDTRRIEGLLCFGDQSEGQDFPEELSFGSVVSVGMGFNGRLNCVSQDYFGDMLNVMGRLAEMEFKRPALVLGSDMDPTVASRYFGAWQWAQQQEEGSKELVFSLTGEDESAFSRWLLSHEPDILIWAGRKSWQDLSLPEATLGRLGLQAVSMNLHQDQGLGMLARSSEIGERAIDMLVRGVTERAFGLPLSPRRETVGSQWVDTRPQSADVLHESVMESACKRHRGQLVAS
ncbi:LacI family DNA-binding transcriptional regulator [Pelagicoccus sp. SDUM812003]|uniref:LacI family DNA-binding transcriptional regulator n=1 Tax=Pelagicoccus sp. SDUM812003 TaxID=3041267 RepID=UPI00280FAA79|nr:LacI family DNA-binding transcriptional regulator [Pelagicoccus sp. SDUM812003]MDQ8205241.1 LacI family DNA-binding transcriptional regulator [Pelagicoccus sp. SDUM812003]